MRLAFAGRLRILLTCMDATPNYTCTRPQSRAGLVVASMNGIVTGLGSIAWGAIRKYAPPKPALVAGDDCPVGCLLRVHGFVQKPSKMSFLFTPDRYLTLGYYIGTIKQQEITMRAKTYNEYLD